MTDNVKSPRRRKMTWWQLQEWCIKFNIRMETDGNDLLVYGLKQLQDQGHDREIEHHRRVYAKYKEAGFQRAAAWPTTDELREAIRTLKLELIEMSRLASAEELEAVAATGRSPSPLLTSVMARELATLPPPEPITDWELLVDGYFEARECDPLRWWEKQPSTSAQRSLIRSLFGANPPSNATRGECSFAISQLKRKQREENSNPARTRGE